MAVLARPRVTLDAVDRSLRSCLFYVLTNFGILPARLYPVFRWCWCWFCRGWLLLFFATVGFVSVVVTLNVDTEVCGFIDCFDFVVFNN